jgi:pSer/pThr/pTyr-binding forkhead associated (FHA) protein
LFLLLLIALPVAAQVPAAKPAQRWGRLACGERRFEFDKPSATLGSDAKADAVLVDGTVASMHARFTFKDGRVWVEDLGSKFGTLVAGTALKPGKPFAIVVPVEVTPGAVTCKFEFGDRGAIVPPTQAPKDPKPAKAKKAKAKAAK